MWLKSSEPEFSCSDIQFRYWFVLLGTRWTVKESWFHSWHRKEKRCFKASRLILLTTQRPFRGVLRALFPDCRVTGAWTWWFFCIYCQPRLCLRDTHTDMRDLPILCFALYWCRFPEGSVKFCFWRFALRSRSLDRPTAHNVGHAILLINSRRYVSCHCSLF